MKSLTEMLAEMDTDPREAPTKVKSTVRMDGEFTSPQAAHTYITAGKATVTFRSKKTETRFTYRINKSEDGKIFFVSLLVGENNTSDYQYLGHIFPDTLLYFHGKKSKISYDATGAKAFAWVYKQLLSRKLPDSLEVWHEGCCGRCGRKLTVPESINSGFGPECSKRI